MNHVVLLGDSIFDNGAYTRGEPDVITHLRTLLPSDWKATLCAVDGATTGSTAAQLRRVPSDATHLVVSVGGNDALFNADLLTLRVKSSHDVLEAFADRIDTFERAYAAALDAVLALDRWTGVCTVYNGALDPGSARAARIGLTIFNDAILRTAVDRGVDVLELRAICTQPDDYANPIEPSGRGGLKIASGVARLVGALPTGESVSRIVA